MCQSDCIKNDYNKLDKSYETNKNIILHPFSFLLLFSPYFPHFLSSTNHSLTGNLLIKGTQRQGQPLDNTEGVLDIEIEDILVHFSEHYQVFIGLSMGVVEVFSGPIDTTIRPGDDEVLDTGDCGASVEVQDK